MTHSTKKLNKNKKNLLHNETVKTKSNIIFDLVKRDIEKYYNIESVKNTEAYYSNRYGWTLRKNLS